MKIAFIAPHLKIAGGTRIFLRYAALLSLRGHEVRVYVRESSFLRRTLKNIFSLGYPRWVGELGSVRIQRVGEFTNGCIEDGDIIIATNHQTAFAIAPLRATKGKQIYLLQHDEGMYHGERKIVDDAYRLPQQKIVVATWLKELLRDKHHADAELLINPIDTKQFFEVPGKRDPSVVRIMLLAHSYEWKGTREGLEIIGRLKKKYPQVRSLLFGVREKDINSEQCDEYVFDPPQEKLRELYSSSDIYLCPSWDEGFGLPSVEAMACGAVLVTYDNGGSRDYAKHEDTALVARHKDTADLERQVERLITDIGLRKKIAQRGKEYVLAMPGWDERTAEFERVLKKIMAR